MPIALSDTQLSIIIRGAEPLLPQDRDAYLHRVASLLHGQVVGDGSVGRAAAQAQRELFKAPDLRGDAGEPRLLAKLQQRRSSSAA